MASSQNESRIAPGQVFLQQCQNQRCARTATATPSAMGLDLEPCGCWRSGDLKVLFGMLVKTVSVLYIHKVGQEYSCLIKNRSENFSCVRGNFRLFFVALFCWLGYKGRDGLRQCDNTDAILTTAPHEEMQWL